MNPKGKKSINLTVPISSGLTGKNLKTVLTQLFGLFNGLVDTGINLENFQQLASSLDSELKKKMEQAIK